MLEAAAVWIIVLQFSLGGYSGQVIARDKELRKFYAIEKLCLDALPAARRLIASRLPLQPDKIECAKIEAAK